MDSCLAHTNKQSPFAVEVDCRDYGSEANYLVCTWRRGTKNLRTSLGSTARIKIPNCFKYTFNSETL